MGFFDPEKMRLGKAKYCVERTAAFVPGGIDATVLPTITGTSSYWKNRLKLLNSVAAQGEYVCGLETFAFCADKTVLAECAVDGLTGSAPYALRFMLSDGTNSLTLWSESSLSGENGGTTKLTSVLNGVSTTVTLCPKHNISGNTYKLYCFALRIDKNRGSVALCSGGHTLGEAAVAGLDALGDCSFSLRFAAAEQNALEAHIGQVRVRLWY